MKKGFQRVILITLISVLTLCSFTACNPTHTHSWGEWEIVKNPTCTEKGAKKRVCGCGAEETADIDKTAHDFGDWTIEENADCTKSGKRSRVCRDCNYEENEIIPQGKHVYTKYGSNENEHWGICEVCGNSDGKVQPHDYAKTWTTDRTSHWHSCICGKEQAKARHTFVNGICSECEYELVATDNLEYEEIDGGYSVKGLSKGATDTVIVIPDKHSGRDVIAISQGAFDSNDKITDVIIGNNVKIIGKNAFNYATNLQSVIIPEGVTEIGESAFFYTGLTSVVVPSTVTTWGNSAFAYCRALEEAKILCPKVGRNAFYGDKNYISGLKRVQLADNATTIDAFAFKGCFLLEQINLPDTIKTIDAQAFKDTVNLHVEITLRAEMYLGEKNFENSGVTKVTIEGWGKSYGDHFVNCANLHTVIIGDEVQTLPTRMFYNLPALKNISIGSGLNKLGTAQFAKCNARETLTISPNNTKYKAKNGAIVSLDETWIYLGNPQGEIFDGTTYINNYAFSGLDAIKTLSFPSSVLQVKGHAFSDCVNLTSVTLPTAKTAFNQVEARAFSGCTSLKEVTVPENITGIGGLAFENCSALEKVTFLDTQNWKVWKGSSSSAIAVDVGNPAKNAEMIKGQYNDYEFSHKQ